MFVMWMQPETCWSCLKGGVYFLLVLEQHFVGVFQQLGDHQEVLLNFFFGQVSLELLFNWKILENNGYAYGRTNWFTYPFQIIRHTAVIPKKDEHQSGHTVWVCPAEENEKLGVKTLTWERWENPSNYFDVLKTLEQKHLVVLLHLKLTFHFWMKLGPQICFLGFTGRYLLFDFPRSIHPHPSWDFLF